MMADLYSLKERMTKLAARLEVLVEALEHAANVDRERPSSEAQSLEIKARLDDSFTINENGELQRIGSQE